MNNNSLGALLNNSKLKPEVTLDTVAKTIDVLSEDQQVEDTKSTLPNEIHAKLQEKKAQEEILLGEEASLNEGPVHISDDNISDPGDHRVTKEDTKMYKRALILKIDRYSKLVGQLIPKLNYDTSLADLEMYSDKVEDAYTRKGKMQIYRLIIQGIAWSVEWLCIYMGQKKMSGWSNHIKETIAAYDIYFDEMTKPIITKIKDKDGTIKSTIVENPSFLNKLQLSPTANLAMTMVHSFIIYYGSMKFLDAVDFSNIKAEEEKKAKSNDEYEFLDQKDEEKIEKKEKKN